MNSFDMVMERAYDEKMSAQMKESYSKGKDSASYVKQANDIVKEARKLVKNGDTKTAKKKYQEALKLLITAANTLNRSYSDLQSSGDYGARFGKIMFMIVAALIVIFVSTLKVISSPVNTLGSFAKTIGKQGIGIGTALIAQNLGIKWVNKDNEANYKAFMEEIKEDPKKVLKGVANLIDDTYKAVETEMKENCG